MDANANANVNADAGGNTIALRECCSGELIINIFSIWCNVKFVSVFTALNNTKKAKKI